MSIESQKHHSSLEKQNIENLNSLEFHENKMLLEKLNDLGVFTDKKEKIIWMIDTYELCHCHTLIISPMENSRYLINWKDDEIGLSRGLVSLSIMYDKNNNEFANVTRIEKHRDGIEKVNDDLSAELDKRISLTTKQLEYEANKVLSTESKMIRGTDKEVAKELFEWKKAFKARKQVQEENFKNLNNVQDNEFDDINLDELF
jgi:hypothetical protein